MSAIYEMIERNDNACRVLVFHGGDRKILTEMTELAREKSIDYWRGELKSATEAELDMLYIHLSNGLPHGFPECQRLADNGETLLSCFHASAPTGYSAGRDKISRRLVIPFPLLLPPDSGWLPATGRES